jgi:hypothetical protein
MTEGVGLVDGALKLVEHGRATALHGRDPHRDADRTAAQLLEGRDADVIVAIGLGLGFLLDALERRHWTGRVLALEPEPRTVEAMQARRDWTAWTSADRLRILTAPEFAGATDGWRWLGDGSVEPPLFVHPVLERLRPEQTEAARAVLRRMRFDATSNAEARRLHGARYLLNTLRNLPAIASEASAERLFGAAARRPAVVVAAGPSLDRALPALRTAQESALIISVDTALRPLLNAGVVPHLVVAVDPSEANGRHLTDLPDCPDTYLVAEASLEPLAIETFRGRTFLFTVADHQPWPWLASAGRPPARLRAWGSVLTTAFDLALTMGCDPVAFAGADLAYTSGRPYCHGVTFEEDWLRLAHWGEPVARQFQETLDRYEAVMEDAVDGESVRTAPHLRTFRDWLIGQMGNDSSRRFINATGGGILRGGRIEQTTPDGLVGLLPPPDTSLRHLVQQRYRAAEAGQVADAVRRLLDGIHADDPEARAILDSWEQFAPGISREQVVQRLRTATRVLTDGSSAVAVEPAPAEAPDPVTSGTARAEISFEPVFLQQLARAMPLVPLHLAPGRMQTAPSGARVFRFRTTAARIICCSLRPQDGAITENGRPLTLAVDLAHVVPGSYSLCRDEVHFRASDDSDPRTNGRAYTLLVPPPVAYLETLPVEDILDNGI